MSALVLKNALQPVYSLVCIFLPPSSVATLLFILVNKQVLCLLSQTTAMSSAKPLNKSSSWLHLCVFSQFFKCISLYCISILTACLLPLLSYSSTSLSLNLPKMLVTFGLNVTNYTIQFHDLHVVSSTVDHSSFFSPFFDSLTSRALHCLDYFPSSLFIPVSCHLFSWTYNSGMLQSFVYTTGHIWAQECDCIYHDSHLLFGSPWVSDSHVYMPVWNA